MNYKYLKYVALLFFLVPYGVSATEWIDCRNEKYIIELLANPGSSQIIDYQFFIDDIRQDLGEWKVELNFIDFENRKIKLKCVSEDNSNQILLIDANYKDGKLMYNGTNNKVDCDWTLFFAELYKDSIHLTLSPLAGQV